MDSANPSTEPIEASEEVISLDNWKTEAGAVIKDVGNHVKHLAISEKLESCNTNIFLNLTTKEDQKYTIEQSACGFQIVGLDHDSVSLTPNDYFETPYALLDSLSPEYRKSFGTDLMAKLSAVNAVKQCED